MDERLRTLGLIESYIQEARFALQNGSDSNFRYFSRAAIDYAKKLEETL